MKNVLKYDDLLEIETFLREKEMDSNNISIVMLIDTQERLNRINKDYYYKLNPDGDDNLDYDVTTVNIQVGNVKFIYKLRDSE